MIDYSALIGCFETAQQAEAIVLPSSGLPLSAYGLRVPEGLFQGAVERDALARVLRDAEREAKREQRRREQRRARALQQRRAAQKK